VTRLFDLARQAAPPTAMAHVIWSAKIFVEFIAYPPISADALVRIRMGEKPALC
jgi:hypothetical protein